MIEIKSTITLPQINALYTQLNKDVKGGVVDVQLPKELKSKNFGLLFSLIQFVSTWIRQPMSGNLILPVNSDEEAIEYLKNEYVYPIVVMSWEKEIKNLLGDNIRAKLKIPSQEYYKQMDFFETKEKDSIPVFCFDHDLSKRGKSRVFYDMNNRLMSEANMDFTLHPAFEKLANHINKLVFKESIKKELTSFYGIIHELFSNTNEHATTDENGYNLYPNIRALYIKFHRTTIAKYLDIYKDFPGLLNFFNSEFKVNQQNQLYLIELSVLDSGPGLVKRYTGKRDHELSIDKQVEVIKQCLYIHNTSSTELNKNNKGYGLDRMLKIIDGKGFVRIKTGKADVFRDMKNNKYVEHKSHSEIKLFDWVTNSDKTFTSNELAEGTLISILYPLDFLHYE